MSCKYFGEITISQGIMSSNCYLVVEFATLLLVDLITNLFFCKHDFKSYKHVISIWEMLLSGLLLRDLD